MNTVSNPIYLIQPLVLVAVSVALIILILSRTKRNLDSRILCGFLLTAALWGALVFAVRTRPDTHSALIWERGLPAVSYFTFLLYYHFTLVYTNTRSSRQKRVLYAAYTVLVVVVVISPTDLLIRDMHPQYYGYAPIVGSAAMVLSVSGFLFMAGGAYNLLKRYRTSHSYEERNRILYLLIGVPFPLLGAALDAFTGLPPVAIWGNLVFCLMCGIAILKYHLLDIRIVLKKGLVYLLLSAIVGIPYVSALVIVSQLVGGTGALWKVHAGVVLLAAIALGPLHSWAQRMVDKLFYRERYDYLKALQQFSHETHSIANIQKLGSNMVQLVGGGLHASSSCLLLPSENRNGWVVTSDFGLERSPEGVILKHRSALLRWLKRHGRVLFSIELDIIPELGGISRSERQSLDMLEGELFVPIRTRQSGLSGVLVLGKKLSQQPYSEEDTKLITAVASQMAMAFENASLYRRTLKEVTERSQAEEQFRKSEEKLRLMFESMAEGIVVTDLDANIIETNEVVVSMHGYASRDEFTGRSIVTLVATKDHARIMEDMGNTLNTGFTRGLYYDFLTTDGVQFPVRLSMALLKDPSDRPAGFVVVAEDVSESRKMEEQLQHSQLLASLGEMTAGIAHEVNNPLATVLLYSEMLMDSEVPREINRDLRIVHDEVKRAAQIMTNLLTYSCQSTSKVRRLNLNKILRKVTDMRRYTQTVQNITVYVDLPEEQITVRGNAPQLTQVFMNLVVNAEEAVRESEDRTIVITAGIDGDWVKVSVADTGTGIPEENLGQVFYPFFSTKRNRKGTGLGLSICYGIVTEHGGLIHVENNPTGGATFSVELPLSTSQKKASLSGREHRRLPTHYPHGRPAPLSPSST